MQHKRYSYIQVIHIFDIPKNSFKDIEISIVNIFEIEIDIITFIMFHSEKNIVKAISSTICIQ